MFLLPTERTLYLLELKRRCHALDHLSITPISLCSNWQLVGEVPGGSILPERTSCHLQTCNNPSLVHQADRLCKSQRGWAQTHCPVEHHYKLRMV